MRITTLQSPEAIGEAVAGDIARRMQPGRRFLLGCPAGRSARPVYAALARLSLDLSGLVLVMMDDYVIETDAGPVRPPSDRHYSCAGFAEREIAAPLGLRAGAIWLPDPSDPAAFERHIDAAGGIDFFILASGQSDGHVAFNPPGSPRASRTRLVSLSERTRLDNMATFPAFASLAEVPRLGVTVGIDTIAAHSRAAAMVVWGEDKRLAWQRLSRCRAYEADWPATVIAECREATLYGDAAASSA